MKFIIFKLVVLFISTVTLFAEATSTETIFEDRVSQGTNSFGSAVFEQDVTIKTNNYKVDNFWNRFHENGEAQSNHGVISKSATVEITAESSSLCTMYSQLDKNGCSGQKPFLINDEALVGVSSGDTISLAFQKDYDFSTNTILYNDTNSTVFYPLDIGRGEKFYKDQEDKPNSFFNFFESMFNTFFGDGSFFSSFFSFSVVDKESENVEDVRQRYVANIVSGVDQDHLMEANVTQIEKDMSGYYLLNTPVSLIDYTEDTSVAGSCNLFFFQFPEDNMFCQLMSGMPFMSMFTNSKPDTNYVIDTIQADTENALISFAADYADITINEYQAGTTYVKQSESTGLISGMIDMMKCMFFGCSEVNNVEEPMDSYYAFTDENAISMTFAVTNDSDQIDDFQTFKLMGIHSLSGNEHMCQVKETRWNDKWTEHTFRATESDTKPGGEVCTDTTETVCEIQNVCEDECTTGFSMMGFCMGTIVEVCSDQEVCNDVTTTTCEATEVPNTYSAKYMDETVQSNLGIDLDNDDELTPSEWLTWCDYIADKTGTHEECTTETTCDGFYMPFMGCVGTLVEDTVCTTVTDPMEEDGYEILSYTNESKRGLVLDLKLVDLNVTDTANTLRYNIMNIR